MAMLGLSAIAAAGGVDQGGWVLPVGFAGAAIGMVGAARSLMLRIEVSPDGLVLVNWFRTVHLPWAQITRCGCDSDGLWVQLIDGGLVVSSPFQHGSQALGFARRPAETAAARLEKIRRKRRRHR
ncbi:hypothetical protein Are01nite_23370 [Actinoplanes regularis]|nr:hypothetical protein Are01nite_23370 [Actinoplanes regularis]